jgi:hypothetical protein
LAGDNYRAVAVVMFQPQSLSGHPGVAFANPARRHQADFYESQRLNAVAPSTMTFHVPLLF